MLLKYLPPEKIENPTSDSTEISTQNKNSSANYKYINTETGLQYSAGMEEVYKNILETFCNLKAEKKNKIQDAFESEDWKNYTIFIHALKSTSLQIGGEKISVAAKELEISSKVITSKITSEDEKQEAKNYIEKHHAEVMKMYDEICEEALQVIKNF